MFGDTRGIADKLGTTPDLKPDAVLFSCALYTRNKKATDSDSAKNIFFNKIFLKTIINRDKILIIDCHFPIGSQNK